MILLKENLMKRRDRIKKKYGDAKQKASFNREEYLAASKDKPGKDNKSESKSIYYKHYKLLLLIPNLILIMAFVIIFMNYSTTGDFINRGISLKGGISIQIPTQTLDMHDLEAQIKEAFPDTDIIVRKFEDAGTQIGLTVEANILPENEAESTAFKAELTKITGITEKEMSIQTIGTSLGNSFFKQTMVAILIAFVFMGLVVFLYFKTFVPSAAVILSAFSDIVVTLAIVDLMGIKIGTAGIAAFLMLIGYSVDTDILLTTRTLKSKEGTIYHRIINAMKTGMTMSITTLVAVASTYFIAESEVLREIMIIIIIGLVIDIINTWLQNATILRYYLEHKKKGSDE